MRAKEFLREYSRDITAQNYRQTLLATAKKDKTLPKGEGDKMPTDEELLEYILSQFEDIDPTPHKQYVQWLTKVYTSGNTKFEDMFKAKDYLIKFDKLKNRNVLPANNLRDINTYKDLTSLYYTLKTFSDVEEKIVNKGNSEEHYNDAQIRVIIPLDEDAAKYYGQGTQWCTAARNNNMFERYNKAGKLYIILPKQPAHIGEKYQFSFAEHQYMDETDSPANLLELATRFPQLKKIFHEQAVQDLCYHLLPNGKEILNDWGHITNEVVQLVMGQIPVTKIVKSVEKEILRDYKTTNQIEFRELISQLTIDIANTQHDIIVHFMVALSPKLQYDSADEEEIKILEELRDWMTNEQVGDLMSSADYDGTVDEMAMTYSIVDYMSLYILPLIKQAIRTQIT